MKRTNFPDRKDKRRLEAAERQAKHDSLTVSQRRAKLATRPGQSKKERAKLDKMES